jgi:acyl-coenzyme A thioesterase PaaI-like protein
MYGGIIASLMDCHCAAAAVAKAYDDAGRSIGSKPRIYYLTGRLTVDFLSPTPMTGNVELVATVDKLEGRKAYVRGSLSVAGVERARCSALFVRPEWTVGNKG